MRGTSDEPGAAAAPHTSPPAAAPAAAPAASGPGKLLSHSLVYGFGIVMRPMVAFLMLPVYTHFIRSAQYGVLELLHRGGDFVAIALALGLAPGMMRQYALRQTVADKRELVSTALIFSGLWGLLLSGGLMASAGSLSRLATKAAGNERLLIVVLLTVWLETGIRVPLSYMRAKEQSKRYTAINVARLIAGVGLNLYFVVVLRLGIAGIIYAAALVSTGSWLTLSALTLRETGFRFSRGDLLQILGFGLPLAIGGLPTFGLHFADRFVLARYATSADIGVYAVGYRLGMLVGVLVNDPFGLAYEPYSYAIESRPESKQIYSRTLTYHALAGLLVFVLLSCLGGAAVRVMTAPDYFGAERVIPWVALGYVFYGVSNTARLGLLLRRRTELTLPLNAAAAAFNVGANFLLIPRYGIQGAAIATTGAFLFLAVINYAVAYRVYAIPCEAGRLAKAVGSAVVVAFAAVHFAPEALFLRLLVGAAAAAAFPTLLLALGFLHDDEAAVVSRIVARLLSALRAKGKVECP